MGKKRQKKTEQQENPNVAEAARIRISQILEQFRAAKDQVYTFEANLSNRERAVVHEVCKKMGMKSKSSGRGNQRRVSVYKNTKNADTAKAKDNITCLNFSEESKLVLQELFANYPPEDGEFGAKIVGIRKGKNSKIRGMKDDIFSMPSMTKADIKKRVESLNSRIEKAANLRQIVEERSRLPIASFRDVITSSVDSHQVVLISGETGCGKTTQVPQFLLDHKWGKGEACKIVCTQPRRISATSVAERISYERGENIGDDIGYKDEIHERDRYSDFILAIIRDILPSYPHLRLIMMSATLDAERFSQYFGGCPIICVPGFTYPVKSFYLEDVLSILKSPDNNHIDSAMPSAPQKSHELTEEDKAALDEAINLAWTNDEFDTLLDLIYSEAPKVYNHHDSLTGLTPLMVFAGKGRVGDVCMLLSVGADCHSQDKNGLTALDWAKRENQQETAEVIKGHVEKQLLRKICIDSKDGAVLVFLPGWDDINKTRERKVFKRPPQGCRKIILSTNIAESAITIDDVVYVIDSGRMKEKSYDPYNNVSTLQSSWVKLIDPNCKIEDFLRKTLDPPVPETIHNAITVLQDIGALSLDEQLTELGEKLGCLPVHPLTSKMLFFAILMNCLDPALTLACASDYRDPFTLPVLPNEKKRATAAKFDFASLYGGHSDQLAVIAAFECWKNAKGRGQEAWFCSQYFISSSTMNMLHGMRKQLESELIRNGFIQEDVSCCNLNAHDPGIIRAVLVAGMYPMVGRFLPPRNGKRFHVETATGAKVRLHPHSLIFKLSFKKTDDCPLIVYDEITRGNGDGKLGGNNYEKIMSSPDNSVTAVVDRWLYFGSTALDVAQIYCLRERLSAAVLFKVKHPREVLPPALEASMHAAACVLSYDGLSGISLPLESVDSLTSMIRATGINNSAPGRRMGPGQNSNDFLKSLISPNIQHTGPSHYHKARFTGFQRKSNGNELSSQDFIPPGKIPYQRPPMQGPNSVGYDSGTHESSNPGVIHLSGSVEMHPRSSGLTFRLNCILYTGKSSCLLPLLEWT
ncbi:hypothetical protein GH714_033802 [Hevea brasiliensis]|uniref:Uncharacterized protein n=1 Tax=Hevea brasiliensis TaxID=3981 RepID=A0A6A6LPP6_HEVBR|nr:hypothetical protein GH714_033802 [Hevea brasiliensis]